MSQVLLPTQDEIRRYARGALREADALNTVPVPLDEITQARGLRKEDLFDVGFETMPEKMKRAAAKFSGLVLGALSKEKTLYVNSAEPEPRVRFTQAHELGHSALPWHEAFFYVDGKTDLDPNTERELEAEANTFAAELVFSLDRFADEADSFAPALGVPLQLSNKFGVSRHAALRRYAQTSSHPVALVTMGQYPVGGSRHALRVFAQQCESSASFERKFGPVTTLIGSRMSVADHPCIEVLAQMTQAVHGEPIDIVLNTKRGLVAFQGHPFFNRHCRFLLLTQHRRLGRRVRLAPAT